MIFAPSKAVYVRAHVTMAVVFMALGMAVLWYMGNPHIWTGAIGGMAAVALRGWYLMDEVLTETWTLTPTRLEGPGGRLVPLNQIKTLRTLGGSVQVVTQSGDKHLIKHQADPQAVIATIDTARH